MKDDTFAAYDNLITRDNLAMDGDVDYSSTQEYKGYNFQRPSTLKPR